MTRGKVENETKGDLMNGNATRGMNAPPGTPTRARQFATSCGGSPGRSSHGLSASFFGGVAAFARTSRRSATVRLALVGLTFACALGAFVPGVQAQTDVARDWALTPSGVRVGSEFRLLFMSRGTRNAESSDIAVYNTWIQGLVASGHSAIQTYSTGFRVVGCTASVDARDNTSTTYTGTDKGPPIYWLNGNNVADHYQDFYDGSWDDETGGRNASGNGRTTTGNSNRPFTGCNHNGRENFSCLSLKVIRQ